MLAAKVECMRRVTSGTDIDCNLRNCDDCELCYEQRTMGEQIEAMTIAISALQAQDVPDTNVGNIISRQAAIDELAKSMPRSYTQDGSHPADEEIFKAQEAYADCIQTLKSLPPAQPEIIRCKECKHRTSYWGNCKFLEEKYHRTALVDSDDFCSGAERRTDK